jgi:hypothetical protein
METPSWSARLLLWSICIMQAMMFCHYRWVVWGLGGLEFDLFLCRALVRGQLRAFVSAVGSFVHSSQQPAV